MDLNSETITKFYKNFLSHPEFQVSKNAIGNSYFKNVVIDRNYIQSDTKDLFSKKIDIKVSPSDQEESGRCWMFAMLNVIRLDLIKKMNLDTDFEFSQNYLFFFFKLEQANHFLKLISDYKKEPIDSRENFMLLDNPVEDGGHFQMFADLIEKYGIVPKAVMGDSVQAKSTDNLNKILKLLLRESAVKIRSSKTESGMKTIIRETLEKVFNILVIFLGEPPSKFDWEYYRQSDSETKKSKKKKNRNKEKKSCKKVHVTKLDKKKVKRGGSGEHYRKIPNLTPKTFFRKYVPFKPEDYVVLIDYTNKPRNELYNVEHSKAMVNGSETNYINTSIDTIKKITKISVDGNSAVWFGCDVGKYSSSKLGIMDRDMFKYNEVIGYDMSAEKTDTLDSQITELSHAMVIKGYTVGNKKVMNWLVENSWGDSTGKNGNFKMSDSWFDDFVMMIAIKKKYVPKSILKVLKKKPKLLPSWCPFGGLMK